MVFPMFFPSSNRPPLAHHPGPRLPPRLDPSRPVAATSNALGAAEAPAGGAAQEAEVHGGRKARRPGKSWGWKRMRVFVCQFKGKLLVYMNIYIYIYMM